LSAVRALGRAGVPVAVSASRRPTLAMWSRFASSTFLTNDPKLSAQAFAEQLAEELRARYAACALVGSDEDFWAMSRFRDLLPISARKILPPHISVVRSLDHEALHDFAESLGVPCAPLVRLPENATRDEILGLLHGMSYPQLFRPIIPWIEREDGTRRVNKRFVVKSEVHLLTIIEEQADLIKNGVLVSAYQTKRALSYFGVCDKGQVLVEGFQERLNEQEPYNEVATLAVTIEPIAVIRRHAQNLLQALQWQGPFKVEFIKDQRGNYRLISLIGRLWGSLQLAISAGVNIPLICYRLAEGTLTRDLLGNAEARVRMRWLVGDAASKIFNAGHVVKNIWAVSNNLAGFSKLKAWLGQPKTTTCYDVFDIEDPMPFLFELQHKTWRRAFERYAGN
jgi:predicted ATP-grasp superfamily ATP-dependent carboligase